MFHWMKKSSASEQRSSVEFLLIVLEAVLTACFLQTCCGETWAILSACLSMHFLLWVLTVFTVTSLMGMSGKDVHGTLGLLFGILYHIG